MSEGWSCLQGGVWLKIENRLQNKTMSLPGIERRVSFGFTFHVLRSTF
jgi:hypothetical protein